MLLLSCELDMANCVGQCGTLLLGRLTWKPVRTVSGRCVYVLGRGGGGQVTEEWETISARWWLGGRWWSAALVVLSRTARRRRLFLKHTFVL